MQTTRDNRDRHGTDKRESEGDKERIRVDGRKREAGGPENKN
jgi:hypothetical protein